ncbi:MAG TPA: redoxin domain-containing protein [Acidimicrobiia bacterium]|nr:redoxin domain-containing protein [Acidimicrobiia bacterium]
MTDGDIQALYLSAEQRWMQGWVAGPTLEGNPLRRGDKAPDVEVVDAEGNAIWLASAWAQQPALVLLWRHLGCGCGMERAERLREEHVDYAESGLNVVIVAPGEVERVAVYKERNAIPVPILADPGYAAHKAFGLGHWSLEQALYDAPDEFCDLREETGRQFQQQRKAQGRRLVDDPWMQSGEFVVAQDGMIRVAYLYNYCADYPDPRVFTTAGRLLA